MMESWPWMVGSNYSIIGQGNSGGVSASQYFPATLISRGTRMPSGFIIRGTGINIENFQVSNMMGHGIVLTSDPSNNASTAGVSMNNIHVDVQGGFGVGVPLLIDGNTIFATFSNMNLIPNSTCNTTFPASILFTETGYSGNGHSDVYFHNLFTLYHHIVIDSPGGQNAGQGTSFGQSGFWWSEEHGICATGGTITLDTGVANGAVGAPTSSARLAGALIENMQNADASNKYLFGVLGNQTAQAQILLKNSDQFNTQTYCINGSTSCAARTCLVSARFGSAATSERFYSSIYRPNLQSVLSDQLSGSLWARLWPVWSHVGE